MCFLDQELRDCIPLCLWEFVLFQQLQPRNLPDVVALLFFEAKKRDVITLTIHFCFCIDILVLT